MYVFIRRLPTPLSFKALDLRYESWSVKTTESRGYLCCVHLCRHDTAWLVTDNQTDRQTSYAFCIAGYMCAMLLLIKTECVYVTTTTTTTTATTSAAKTLSLTVWRSKPSWWHLPWCTPTDELNDIVFGAQRSNVGNRSTVFFRNFTMLFCVS